MNPNLCRIELRPRGPLEVFDLTWRLMATRAGLFTRLFAAVFLPIWIVALPIGWWTDWHWAVGVVVTVLALSLRLPFTLLAGRLMFAETVSIRTVLWDSVRRPQDFFGVWFVHIIGLLGGLLTCGVSLLPVWAVLVWMPESLVLEQRAGSHRRGAFWAGRRSWHLASQGGIAAIAGVAATVFLTVWFAAMAEACGSAITGFLLQFGTPFGSPMQLQATPWILLGILGAQPIIAVYRLLLYVDTRTRGEGWDLQVGLRAMGLK